MISPELIAAYRGTRYVVEASPVGPFTLRVGERSPSADRLCERFGCGSWAFVTACNPRSEVLAPERNEARMAQLLEILGGQAFPHYLGAGIGEDPAWIPEPSVFVAGASREFAIKLALRFEQYAVIYGELGEAAQLLQSGLANE